MTKLSFKIIFFSLLLPFSMKGQLIEINKLLRLQKSSLMNIQDYLDNNSWILSYNKTISNADSSIWNFRITNFIDSIKNNQIKNLSIEKSIFLSKILNTDLNTPLYFIYFPLEENKNEYVQNDFTIKLNKHVIYESISLGIQDYKLRKNDLSISITYKAKDIKKILSQISILKIPKELKYIEVEKDFIKRVYFYKDQVITLTTYNFENNDNFLTYEISISSKSDYILLNSAEIDLKGKVDHISN